MWPHRCWSPSSVTITEGMVQKTKGRMRVTLSRVTNILLEQSQRVELLKGPMRLSTESTSVNG